MSIVVDANMENITSNQDLGTVHNHAYDLRTRSIQRAIEQHIQIQPPQEAQPSALLSVPAEIRLLIFTYLFRTKKVSARTSRLKTRGRRTVLEFFQFKMRGQVRFHNSAVLHTCRQLYQEVRPIMLANTTFVLNDHKAIFPFLSIQRYFKPFLSHVRYFEVSEDSLPMHDFFKNLKLDKMVSLKRLEICMSATIEYSLRSYKDWVGKDEKINDAREAVRQRLNNEHSSTDYRKHVDFHSSDRHQSVKDCIADERRKFTVAILCEFYFETWYKHSEESDEEGEIMATLTFPPGEVEAKIALGVYKCTKEMHDWHFF